MKLKKDMKDLFTQMVFNQNKGKGPKEEEPRRRRNLDFDEHSERENLYQLHRLQQRDKTVEEYRQNMELLVLRAGIREEPRKTIDRFYSGLNLEICDRFKFLPFDELNNLVHFCVRVEQQLNIRYAFKEDYPNAP